MSDRSCDSCGQPLPVASPDTSSLTDRQRKVLACIADVTAARGYPPSVREIGETVGLASPSSVMNQLRHLEAAGFIRRGGGHRTLTVVGAA